MTEDNTGVVTRISRVEDENGVIVLRAIVDFYDGALPDINTGTIWHRRPVTLTDTMVRGLGEEGKEP